MVNNLKVFLGGTCNDTSWRDILIPMFNRDVEYFNPVVEDWTEESQIEEERQKWEECDIHLYVLTPDMKGVFSVAEVVESSMTSYINGQKQRNHSGLVILCVLEESIDTGKKFSKHELASMEALKNLCQKYGAIICDDLESVAETINGIEY